MTQAGDGALLKCFIAGPLDVKAGQGTHLVDWSVAPLKDSMRLGMDFLWDHRAKWTWMRELGSRDAQMTLIGKVPAGSAVLCPVR